MPIFRLADTESALVTTKMFYELPQKAGILTPPSVSKRSDLEKHHLFQEIETTIDRYDLIQVDTQKSNLRASGHLKVPSF